MSEKNIGYYILNEESDPNIVEDGFKIIGQSSLKNRVEAEATLQQMGVKNRNGRTYLAEDLVPELSCERQLELFAAKQMKGEAGHPDPSQGGLSRQQTIDPKCVCVQFLDKFWVKGDLIKGKIRGCSGPLGDAFDADLKDGAKPAFSLRALGGIVSKGGQSYVKNIKLITYDHVIYPSHKPAYTTHLLKAVKESAINENGMFTNTLITEGGLITPLSQKSITEYVKEESGNLKQVINTLELVYESIRVSPNGRSVILEHSNGDKFIINLEDYISDDIMNYCYNNR